MIRWVCMGICAAILIMSTAATLASPEAHETQPRVQQVVRLKDAAQKTQQSLAVLREKATTALSEPQLLNEQNIGTQTHKAALADDVLRKLEEIERKINELNRSIEEIQGLLEGQQESVATMSHDVSELKLVKPRNFVQFQFRDTNEPAGTPDAFAMRRVRVAQTQTIDPRTSMFLSYDIATGVDTVQAQLQDAQLIWDIEPSRGIRLLAGQQILPLGNEMTQPAADRELPEVTLANRTMFSGERGRGVYMRFGLGNNALVHAGLWNALAFNDPEQRGRAPGVSSRLGVTAGFRHTTKAYSLGISTLFAQRPAFTAGNQTSPKVNRRFIYLDGSYLGLLMPNLFVRGEAMLGHDRVPSTTANPTFIGRDMLGWHVVFGYTISPRNQILLRYEQFDPDRDSTGNAVNGYTVAYLYFINPGARLTAAYEVLYNAASRPNRSHATTIRLQFRL